jgi:ubiquinone/menaquinone biosynthesis C-methylase UbiE
MKKDVTKDVKKAFDLTARKYAETQFDFSKLKRQYKEFMGYCKSGKILDLGCGPGRDVKFFMEKGYDVVGVDFSDGMLEEARARVPDGIFQKTDIRRLKFGNNTFDGIWCCASIFFIPKSEIAPVVGKLNSILKKDGIIYFSIKKGVGEKTIAGEYGEKKFYALYDEKEVEDILSKNGFKVVKLYLDETKKNIWINAFAKPIRLK